MAKGAPVIQLLLKMETNVYEKSLDKVQVGLTMLALAVVRDAKIMAPPPPRFTKKLKSGKWVRKLTGFNRASITHEVERTPTTVKAAVFTLSGYGGYLETGTRKMPARPYILPAYQKNKGQMHSFVKFLKG